MKKVLILSFLLSVTIESFSQCCSPGSPTGGSGNNGVLDKDVLRIISLYKGSYSGKFMEGDQLYGGDTKLYRRFTKDANYNFIGFNLAYGISNKLTVESDFGYFINKTQRYTEGITPTYLKGDGLTDLALQFKLTLFKSTKKQWEFTPGLGLKVPLGKYDQESQGATLPPDLQPSTGAFNYLFSFFLYKGYIENHLRFFLTGRFEFPKENPLDYKYGDSYAISFFTSYSISPHWSAILQFRGEYRNQDVAPLTNLQAGGAKYVGAAFSTGSKKIFMVPQINYSIKHKWDVSFLVDIPLYQYYNGYQLGNTFAVSVFVSRKINCKKSEIHPVINPVINN